jgi:putative peptide zinc metalloprotease protein
VLDAHLKELSAQYDALIRDDRVQAAIVREEMNTVAGNLATARERQVMLTVRSATAGRFVVPNAADLPGRFLSKGQLIGYVVAPKELTTRVAVEQDAVDQVRSRTKGVEVMLADWGASPVRAEVRREVPGGSRQLPSAALGAGGGGPFAIDPHDNQGVTALNRIFQFELVLPGEEQVAYLGSRVFVRFDHGLEPVGFQLYRALRQLLLRRFDV